MSGQDDTPLARLLKDKAMRDAASDHDTENFN
jgi:hypothetical protein